MSAKRRHPSQTPRNAEPPFVHEEEPLFEESYQEHEPSSAPRPVSRQSAYDVDRIGDILRRVREHRGEDLGEISEYLRIRPNYLFALESSRYEDLPADAYVIGFLRTYASYLGLDGKGAVDQYRREMAGRRRKPQLSMPQPMTEGRAPTVAVLIGAAIVALLIYGIWYGLSSPDRAALEQPLALPTVPQEIGQTAPATQTPNDLTSQTATSDGISLSIPVTAVPAAPDSAQTQMPTTTTPADKQDTPPAESGKEPDAANKTKEKPVEPKTENKTDKPQPSAAAPAQDMKPESEAAAAFGEKNKSRLSIKAEKSSWILVTDSKGNTVFDRTLKAGETYNVPAGKELKLTTSNPADVAFSIDGKDMPKLKNDTAIVRALTLEPDRLKKRLSGTPVVEEEVSELGDQ